MHSHVSKGKLIAALRLSSSSAQLVRTRLGKHRTYVKRVVGSPIAT
jgi:hypothetical protein